MKANTINGVIRLFNSIPKTHDLKPNIFNYHLQDESVHYADGYRDYISIEIIELQKKDGYIFDSENDVYTDNVINKTDEEIEQEVIVKKSDYNARVNSYFSYMYIRALSSSMNKNSSDLNYLLGLKEEYTDKYNVSKGIITSGVVYDATLYTIQSEMENEFNENYLNAVLANYGLETTGTHLEKMYRLIVFKFEYGLNAFNEFNKFIRVFRTKCVKWIDDSEYNKLDEAFLLVDGLPSSLTQEEALSMFNEFNLI